MKSTGKLLTLVFAAFMVTAGLTHEASAQSVRYVRRPIIVRSYIYRNPFWYSRYYDPFYSPYYTRRSQRSYLREELAGNQRELAKHQRKYSRDGVITDKERRELQDDVRDVQRSRQRLRDYGRYY